MFIFFLDDLHRANQAYSWAQRVDPAYVNCWVGQAMIAEKVASRDAMDLFRHTTQLSYNSQSVIGYAHWVLSTMLNPDARRDPSYNYSIVNMHAVQLATDCITWYIGKECHKVIVTKVTVTKRINLSSSVP